MHDLKRYVLRGIHTQTELQIQRNSAATTAGNITPNAAPQYTRPSATAAYAGASLGTIAGNRTFGPGAKEAM
jgi:hypothetical protein